MNSYFHFSLNLNGGDTIKYKTLFIALILVVMTLGCAEQDIQQADQELQPELYTIYGNFSDGITFEHTLPDGTTIQTRYTTDYNVNAWKITDNKTITIELTIMQNPHNSEILIEHMHADVFVEATTQYADGLKQDSMDDNIHGGEQPGFLVTVECPYSEIFSIEGYSQFLIDGWMFIWSGWGYGRQETKRLNEDNLKHYGTYGSEIVIIYDVLIKDQKTGLYYKTMIRDIFIVGLDGNWIGRK